MAGNIRISDLPTLPSTIDTAIIPIVQGGTYTINLSTLRTQILKPATTTTLGAVKVGAGLSINEVGILSSDNATYTLPFATASILGGVKVGAGLRVTADGVLSALSEAPTWSEVTNKPTFAIVATSGSYADLTNKPTIPPTYTLPIATAGTLGGVRIAQGLVVDSEGYVSVSTALTLPWDNITSKPNFATVATSGQYTDLLNKPAPYVLPTSTAEILGGVKIGSGIVINQAGVISVPNPAWEDVTGKPVFANVATSAEYTDLLNRPQLSQVAISGSYTDLSNKPVIPAAQIQSDWTQATNTALDYIKNKPVLATVATSGSYNDLADTPSPYALPTAGASILGGVKIGTRISIDVNGVISADAQAWETITGKPTFATVATSGLYSDLSGTPTIPSIGSLNFTNSTITSNTSNADVVIQGNGTGAVVAQNLKVTQVTAAVTLTTSGTNQNIIIDPNGTGTFSVASGTTSTFNGPVKLNTFTVTISGADKTMTVGEIVGNIIRIETDNDRLLTLPDATTLAGTMLILKNTSATFTVNIQYSGTSIVLMNQGDRALVVSDGVSWQLI